jgi:hypothetical protein
MLVLLVNGSREEEFAIGGQVAELENMDSELWVMRW